MSGGNLEEFSGADVLSGGDASENVCTGHAITLLFWFKFVIHLWGLTLLLLEFSIHLLAPADVVCAWEFFLWTTSTKFDWASIFFDCFVRCEAARILESADQTVDPCSDFFEFACGQWNREHPIPDARSKYDMFTMLNDGLQDRLRSV